jgi:hypothetical protein
MTSGQTLRPRYADPGAWIRGGSAGTVTGCVRPDRTQTGNREELLHVPLFAHFDTEDGGVIGLPVEQPAKPNP